MLKKFAKYRHNWIPVVAIGLMIVFGLMLLFLDVNPPMGRVNMFDGIPMVVLLLSGSVIAPIVEELSFRGFFSKNSKLKTVALIGFLFYTSIYLYSKYSIWIAVSNVLIFSVLIVLNYKSKSNRVFVPFVISNALVFGLIHYSAEDFVSGSYPFVLIQTVMGLFLTWVTINSKLGFAMIFHGAWNSLAFVSLFLNLQFVAEEKQIIEKDNVKITYQQVPVLDSDVTAVHNESDKVIGKNATIKQLLDLTLYDSVLKNKYSSIVPMARYDFTIEFKDGKRNFEPVLKLLSEEELIVKN